MATLASFFGWRKPSKKERLSTIVLSWDKRYFDIAFQDFPNGLRHATVKDLKQKAKEVTGVPIATMRLKVSGAFLKDDTAVLTSCGVHPGSLVELLGQKVDTAMVQKETASGNPEEYGLVRRIAEVVEPLQAQFIAEIDSFVAMVQQYKQVDAPLTDTDKKRLQDSGIYLSEKLMQALIKLDGVECPFEFETARQRRREGVRYVQRLLDRVDEARAIAKDLCRSHTKI
ncbi:hypothetical protein BCR43DRAFT_564371 [Syncephalastrum racemosum]|uniref:BAG domain-containing protein n=1 Tax=Syncephalastrum racemosum TaxID=13706 RepID=A0A1X2HA21_SYNRA|nr:hypothetical protein BCR43DRAFT_564371 [Syncephalastrum racemosum]